MPLVTINEQNLIDIGDAIRDRIGIFSEVNGHFDHVVSRTKNTTGFDSWNGYADPDDDNVDKYLHYTVPNAVKIVVKISYQFDSPSDSSYIYLMSGIVESYTGGKRCNDKVWTTKTFEFDNTDSVTMRCAIDQKGNSLGFYAEIRGYDENGNIISYDTTTEVRNQYKPREMAMAINNISSVPLEAFAISGSCENRFVNNHWNWFIERFGDKITTKNIYPATRMFAESSTLTDIPFDINFHELLTPDCNDMFYNCKKLTHIGKISNMRPSDMKQMFSTCQMLRNLPEFENLNLTKIQADTSAYAGKIFYQCRSLRSIPESLLKEIYGIQKSTTYSHLNGMFISCEALDEIIGLSPRTGVLTSNAFGSGSNNTFYCCSRIKDLIFDKDTNGAPYEVSWSNQVIDLTQYVGYLMVDTLSTYNSGITADKQVTDDATYQALKNDPDWYTTDVAYSRYNHDSAVRTIGSLPKTTPGQGNTIKFKGASGSATDGGAISNLTEEEIAVATAKGWTVTIV